MNRNDDIFVKKVNDILDSYTRFDETNGKLDLTLNAGFFANCTITLGGLIRIYPSDRYVKVNWPSQDQWRDDDQLGRNLFDLYFQPNSDLDPHSLSRLSPFRASGVLRDLRFDKLTPYIENYFAPSEVARKKLDELVHKYEIDYDNTIGVWYRGTDKFLAHTTELMPVQARYYVTEVLRLIRKNPRLRVLLQTDQEQVRDIFVRELGEHMFYFSELPVIKSLIGVHNMSREDRGISNFEFATTLLAVVYIFAKCRYVVTHTGNVGLWIYLYRGSARNTFQLRSRLPDLISQYEDETGTPSEGLSTQGRVDASIGAEEIYELRSENDELRSRNKALRNELGAIRTSFIYRCMNILATNLDRLFPDDTLRGRFRKRITQSLTNG